MKKEKDVSYQYQTMIKTGYRAIHLGYIYQHHNERQVKDRFRRDTGKVLTNMVNTFCHILEISPNEPLSMMNIEKINDYLANQVPPSQIVIINGKTKTLDYKGDKANKLIIIELIDSHYNLITSIKAYYQRSYFCYSCWKGYKKVSEHKCEFVCNACFKSEGCNGRKIKCERCNREFSGLSCFENHKQQTCSAIKKCLHCEVEYTYSESHICLVYKCFKCGDIYTDSPHYCFMKPLRIKKNIQN